MASPYGPVPDPTNHRLVCPSSDRWLVTTLMRMGHSSVAASARMTVATGQVAAPHPRTQTWPFLLIDPATCTVVYGSFPHNETRCATREDLKYE